MEVEIIRVKVNRPHVCVRCGAVQAEHRAKLKLARCKKCVKNVRRSKLRKAKRDGMGTAQAQASSCR